MLTADRVTRQRGPSFEAWEDVTTLYEQELEQLFEPFTDFTDSPLSIFGQGCPAWTLALPRQIG